MLFENIINLLSYSSWLVIQCWSLAGMLLLLLVACLVELFEGHNLVASQEYCQEQNPLAGQLAWQQSGKVACQEDHILVPSLAFLVPITQTNVRK